MHVHLIEKHYVVWSGGKKHTSRKGLFYYPLRGGCCTSGWKTHTSWTGGQLTEVNPRVQSRKKVFCHTHVIKFKAFRLVSRGKNYIWGKKKRNTSLSLRLTVTGNKLPYKYGLLSHDVMAATSVKGGLRICGDALLGTFLRKSLVPWFSKTKRCAVFRILVNSRSPLKR